MKVHSLQCLSHICRELREEGRRIVLACGCFDVVSIGHVKHLEAARKLGDCLIVTLTTDEEARRQKGKDRPVFNVRQRLEHIAALECVSYVCINSPVPGYAIQLLCPHVYVKGGEYENNLTDRLRIEKNAIEGCGGQMVFTHTLEYHSSEVLNGRKTVTC